MKTYRWISLALALVLVATMVAAWGGKELPLTGPAGAQAGDLIEENQ